MGSHPHIATCYRTSQLATCYRTSQVMHCYIPWLHLLKGHKNIHTYKSLQYGYSVNCPNSAGQRRHGLDMQSLGHINNCNNYGRNIFFAASKIFGRFRNQVPKVKYCHEFTKGHFSQSTLKEVIILLQVSIRPS